jgi:hypothetical protein
MPGSVVLEVPCGCGAPVSIETFTLVNAAERPDLVAQILAGEFHNAPCAACGKRTQVDKWFLFQDPRHDVLVHVFPREYRHSYLELQAQLTPLHKLCGVDNDGPAQLVFGVDGLARVLRGEPAAPPVFFPGAMPSSTVRH